MGQPTNLTFHNFCNLNKVPTSTKKLLGLNLKLCLAGNTIPYNIPHTVRNMAYNIRTKYYLQESGMSNDTDYTKQIYVKNKHWDPPPAPNLMEDKITAFEKVLKAAHLMQASKNSKCPLNNLTQQQQNTLKLLYGNNNFTINPTDKNLGPAHLAPAQNKAIQDMCPL
jgi:hypothetical protein